MRTATVHHHTERSCDTVTELTEACLGASSSKHATPLYPQRCPSDTGSRDQVEAENASALYKNSSDSEMRDRLQCIKEPPHR